MQTPYKKGLEERGGTESNKRRMKDEVEEKERRGKESRGQDRRGEERRRKERKEKNKLYEYDYRRTKLKFFPELERSLLYSIQKYRCIQCNALIL
jgi:hypothetical protein